MKNLNDRRNGSSARRVTGKEIAEKLGISVMTVSRVMNNNGYVNAKTRSKVIAAAQRMGYSPDQIAKSLVLKKTYTIGVVVPEITHSFFPEAIRGIEEATYNAGYHLILTHSAEDAEREKDAIQTLESKRVDGILISMAQSVRDHKVYKQMIKMGIPIVFFDRCVPGIGASCVSIDDKESAQYITEHLISHGYKRIAHLSGPKEMSVARSRLQGYKNALKKNRIPFYESLVVESGFQESGGYAAMKKILQLPASECPDAVVAVNDPAAFGAIKAIHEMGKKIPEDIAIVGFSDDIRAELLATPLTTVRQPAYEVGKCAAMRLLEEIEGTANPAKEISIQTEQVIRRSCGCPSK